MAVSVDTVYQKVLALANKEQRGYITPQEFNLFATHAQMDIFEQYFYDINQFDRLPRNNTEYSDPLTILEDKINPFKERNIALTVVNQYGYIDIMSDLPQLYRLGTIQINRHNIPGRAHTVEQLRDGKEFLLYESNPLTSPSMQWEGWHPFTDIRGTAFENSVYVSYGKGTGAYGQGGIRIYPYPAWDWNLGGPGISGSPDGLVCNYIKKPTEVGWGYTVVNEQAQYNATSPSTIDFELHSSEENNLVFKILQLAGITIKDPNLYQAAVQEEIKDIQQEKQ